MKKITYKDLSTALKIPVIIGYMWFATLVITILISFIVAFIIY